jgi:arsenate reductase
MKASLGGKRHFCNPGSMEGRDAATAFAALGQGTRLALFRALLAAGPDGLAAGTAAARLGVPSSTLSFHLRALERAGLVAATRCGRSLVYVARADRLRALLALLAEGGRRGEGGRGLAAAAPSGLNVLFLCTRNSARSIMAEAILNAIGGGRFRAFSAGSDPAPEGPLPEVLGRLGALGHDVAPLRSKSWHAFTGPDAPRMDLVIALCDTLDLRTAPGFAGARLAAAWPLPDPAKFAGSASERATLLDELYAALHRRLSALVGLPFAALDRLALKRRLDALAQPLAGARA